MVLAIFMGGSAFGNYISGRYLSSKGKAIKAFAIIEFSIGLYAVITPSFADLLRYVFVTVGSSYQLGSVNIQILKFASAFILICFPSILIGMTFPVVTGFMTKSLKTIKSSVSKLYAINSIGAVAGVIISAFLLLPFQGTSKTIYLTGTINLVIAFCSFILVKILRVSDSININEAKSAEVIPSGRFYYISFIVLIISAVSGFTALAYEVLWFRFFLIILGSSAYTFAIILAAFITGIALGSLFVVFFKTENKVNNIRVLSIFMLLIGCYFLLTLLFYDQIPYYFFKLRIKIESIKNLFYLFQFFQYTFCFLIMIFPTLMFGLMIPLISCTINNRKNSAGNIVGTLFAFNTVGCVFGSLTAGFILLPYLGIQKSFYAIVLLNILTGLALYLYSYKKNTKIIVHIFFLFLCFAVFVLSLSQHSWHPMALSKGFFRLSSDRYNSFDDFMKIQKMKKMLYVKDGSQVTVIVGQQTANDNLFLKINGKTDASTGSDISTQLLLAHIPLLFHKKPQNILNIGIGSGMTSGAVLRYPIKRLDVVEISPEVYEASKIFYKQNNSYFTNPKTNVYIEDAKTFLQLTPRKYDIIISEPSNPWISGVGRLFTKEFFSDIKKKLNPKGILMQWFHRYEMSDKSSLVMLRTLRSEFKYIYMWLIRSDVLMLASNSPIIPDFDSIIKKIKQKNISNELKQSNIYELKDLMELHKMFPDDVNKLLKENKGQINSDDMPYFEYEAPKDLFNKTHSTVFDLVKK